MNQSSRAYSCSFINGECQKFKEEEKFYRNIFHVFSAISYLRLCESYIYFIREKSMWWEKSEHILMINRNIFLTLFRLRVGGGGGGGGAFDATQDLNPLLLTNDCLLRDFSSNLPRNNLVLLGFGI